MARLQRELVSRRWRNLCWLLFVAAASASHTVVERSAGGGGAGVYAETEDGQLDEVTSHGVVVSVSHHGREEEKHIEAYDEAGQTEGEDTADHPLHRRRSPSRQKRFMDGRDRTWPKGIVPFSWHPEISTYYTKEAEAAMTLWMKFTCIRFVPWVKGETREKYGLAYESHVEISKANSGHSCIATLGNYRSSTGQLNSCCWRGYCMHELGHTLGLWHEHQSFAAAGFMQLDWNHIPEHKAWYYGVKEPLGRIYYQYDTTNNMHYKNGNKAFRVLYEDLRSLISFSDNNFYMYKDASLYHECKELHCSDFSQQCHNDGFVTLVDNVCACLCPAGLDPATGCKTAIKKVTTNTQWSAGAYALLSSSNGCPDSCAFKAGSWTHKGKGGNSKSSEFHLAGSFDAASFRYEFCVKNNSGAEASNWEPGRYCILRVGGTCPEAFDGGFIQFDDAADSPKTSSGSLPDGIFAEDTRMEFCCRDDGFASVPLLNIPNTQPLVLLMNYIGHCQEIRGMRWTGEYMAFDSLPEKAKKGGSHAFVARDTTFKIWFCHYVPEDLACGGEITLNAANRRAVITSPNYPSAYGTNEECTWVIKAEDKDSRVLLNFDEMKITSVGGDCQDSLEIRYNLPGQPGIRYCGDGLARTIRSLNDVVIMTLRSDHHHVMTDTGFSVTASLFVPEEEESFPVATKGKLYRGSKDYTRSMKPCLPWTKVTKCLHHAFNPSDFGEGLDKNYCRNPDDTAMPWCYTDLQCNRDYCDVSNAERVYDRRAGCLSDTCQQPRDQVLGQGCAATCKLTHPPKPVKDQTCRKPDDLPDGTLVRPDARETYSVGDTLTYTCNTGNETLTRTCLGDGNFSPAGYVCGACGNGFAYRNARCYRYFHELVDFPTARSRCQALGAVVVSVKDKAEQDFVMALRTYHWTLWTGATDSAQEGNFTWEDGTPLNWTNWEKGQPNNYGGGQDCVEMYNNRTFNDICCGTKHPFVCTYPLSARQACVDRHWDCVSMLLDMPSLCGLQPVFADQLCPFSCGLCQPDATIACPTAPPDSTVQLTFPVGQTSVPRGALVRYACLGGNVLTDGQLEVVCGKDGNFIGKSPKCQDPNTIVQDSNDVPLVNRGQTTSSNYAYTSLGASLAITRTGVIKQWKFISSHAGWSIFQVWRPNPAGGNFSFTLVGQNQIMTKGVGKETHDVPEADWIVVQPGDKLGLWEGAGPRAYVPYDYCDARRHPADFGVIYSKDSRGHGDFSPVVATQFSSYTNCRTFSYKAVIHPISSLPASRQRVTSQVPVVNRPHVGAAGSVYITDAANYHIPIDGLVSEWQFYAMHSGSGALQVWRPRPDLGTRKYEFIGQNKVNLIISAPAFHTLAVPLAERIAVKQGDVIGVLYNRTPLGVPYSFCDKNYNPESHKTYWYDNKTPDDVFKGKVFGFSYTGGAFLCRTFSMRAIVTPIPA